MLIFSIFYTSKNDVFNYNSVFELILHEFQLDDAIFINKNSIEASFLIISASTKISETMHSTLFNWRRILRLVI